MTKVEGTAIRICGGILGLPYYKDGDVAFVTEELTKYMVAVWDEAFKKVGGSIHPGLSPEENLLELIKAKRGEGAK